MDKLVRKIEVPLAKKAIEKAGLYIVEKKHRYPLCYGEKAEWDGIKKQQI